MHKGRICFPKSGRAFTQGFLLCLTLCKEVQQHPTTGVVSCTPCRHAAHSLFTGRRRLKAVGHSSPSQAGLLEQQTLRACRSTESNENHRVYKYLIREQSTGVAYCVLTFILDRMLLSVQSCAGTECCRAHLWGSIPWQ